MGEYTPHGRLTRRDLTNEQLAAMLDRIAGQQDSIVQMYLNEAADRLRQEWCEYDDDGAICVRHGSAWPCPHDEQAAILRTRG